MRRRTILMVALLALALVPAAVAMVQLGGAGWWAIPVSGDPGISWMVVMDTPRYRVLRDHAEPGATRRMHHHADATWHVMTVATGKLMVAVEGEPSVELTPGEPLSLKAGVNHTFTNVGTETATIVEVFGKAHR
jgi:quercetin dioxygenase-like cupin family protein